MYKYFLFYFVPYFIIFSYEMYRYIDKYRLNSIDFRDSKIIVVGAVT